MRLPIVPLVFAALSICANIQAQENLDRETEIHRNVRLNEIAVTPIIPANLASQYQKFLPMLREVLKENTKDQADEKSLVLNVAAGIKEVGAAKTKRAQARVTAFCRNSRKEYIGNFILHSYASNGPVNREETEQFLRKQILEPMECYVPTARAAAPVKAKQESVPVVAEVKPAVPDKYEPAPTPAPRAAERSPAAQEKSVPEVEIHKNVYLFDTAAAPEIPADLANQYRSFLPVFKEVLRENTRDQADENRLIMRVAAGIRDVGPAKNNRAHVRITSLIGNTNKEYISDFSLYSYGANRPVNKEEIAQFLRTQILEPLECYAPATSVAATVRPEKAEPAPVPAEQKSAAPEPEERAGEPRMAERSPTPQERSDRESEIRKNIHLIELAAPPDIPAEIAAHYHAFLPMFKEVLKENTRDQTDKDHLIIRVAAGIKEVGSAKIKRAQARVTSFCRNSKKEYIGNFILHSYTTNGPVNKEETAQFLRKQILEPMECYVPAESALASPRPAR